MKILHAHNIISCLYRHGKKMILSLGFKKERYNGRVIIINHYSRLKSLWISFPVSISVLT